MSVTSNSRLDFDSDPETLRDTVSSLYILRVLSSVLLWIDAHHVGHNVFVGRHVGHCERVACRVLESVRIFCIAMFRTYAVGQVAL